MKPVATWTESGEVCRMCEGNGCGTCHGKGEVRGEPTLEHVQCACGFDCTGEQWRKSRIVWQGSCPECDSDLESAVEAACPTKPKDDEPRDCDVDDFDGPECFYP